MHKRGMKFITITFCVVISAPIFSCSLPAQNDNPPVIPESRSAAQYFSPSRCLGGHAGYGFIKKLTLGWKAKTAAERTVAKAYARLAQTNIPAFLALLSDDVAWKYEGMVQTVPFAGIFSGKAGVEKFIRHISRSIVITNLACRYIVSENDRVDVHFLEEGYVKATGKKYAMETAHLWRIDFRGKVIEFQCFNDTFALYSAFIPGNDPAWSRQTHTADYQIPGGAFPDAFGAVHNLYAAFAAGNLQYILNNVSDNVVWIMAGNTSAVPFAGTYSGKQGVQQFFINLMSNVGYDAPYTQMSSVVDRGRVDVRLYESAYSLADPTKKLRNYVLHSIAINAEGKITSFRSYNDTYAQQNIFDWH